MSRVNNENVSAMSSVVGSSLGPELLDRVSRTIAAEKVVGERASSEGLAQSLLHGQFGDQSDGIGRYEPGVDSPVNLDIPNSLAGKEFYARKIIDTSSPTRINVILDTPKRTEYLEGDTTLPWLAAFTLAATARVATLSGSRLRVFNTAAKNSNGIVFDGKPKDANAAFKVMSNAGNSHASSLEDMVSVVKTDLQEEDATVVVSDFMDGYDADADRFDWEPGLIRLASRQEDLLRIVRISSISHRRMPYDQIQGLSGSTIEAINARYAEQARAKEARIKHIFKDIVSKSVTISTDDKKPGRSIINLLVGADEN